MIIAIDTETYVEYDGTNEEFILNNQINRESQEKLKGNLKKENLYPVLNTNSFSLGCAIMENGKELYFYNPELMRSWLLETIEKENRRGHRVFIYAHNHEYDYYAYMKNHLEDPNLNHICFNPLIVKYKDSGYFLDTMAFYKMPLSSLGRILGYDKLPMPKETKSVEELKPYCYRDTQIVLQGILKMKETMKKLGYRPKKFLTIGQLAMTSFLTFCKRNRSLYDFMNKGEVFKSKHTDKIREAFRGARNEAFQKGRFKDVSYVDANGLYSFIMKNMDFPKLNEEMYVERPLEKFSLKDLFEFLGVIKCTIKSPSINLPYLPIKYRKHQLFPRDCKMTGCWTTKEIETATSLGYEIKNIEWAILYPKLDVNPLREYIKVMQQIRMESTGDFQLVVKLLMNNLFGKFAQKRSKKEIKFIKRNELNEYLQKGYQHLSTAEDRYVMFKEKEPYVPKYAHPLISTLITANARDYIYSYLSKIPKEDLLYTDTDSVIFKGNHFNQFTLGKKLGQWKIVKYRKKAHILGEKRYYIGNDVKISGLRAAETTTDVIDKMGIVETKRIFSYNEALRTGEFNKIGTFRNVEVRLSEDAKMDMIIPREIIEKV